MGRIGEERDIKENLSLDLKIEECELLFTVK